ncbi:MAG: sulfotransferase family 2 domain-containing protein, partial [Pseudomonadota bacterium]
AKMHMIRELLPAEIARPAFRLLMPGKYRELRALRTHIPSGPEDRSFAPLIRHQCLFVHIPKTAGISLGRALFGCFTGGHMTMLDYQLAFSADEIERFFTFTFVRNPWDRVVSSYCYLKAGGRNPADAADAARIVAPHRDFDTFVRAYLGSGREPRQKHFIPQHRFLAATGGGPPLVDFIGRFERLEGDFATVCERLDIENRLDRENATGSRPADYRSLYTDQTAEIVGRAYARDAELFDYGFDG